MPVDQVPKVGMKGRQEKSCQWCNNRLRTLTAVSLRARKRRVFTWCDRCDGPEGFTIAEQKDFDTNIKQ